MHGAARRGAWVVVIIGGQFDTEAPALQAEHVAALDYGGEEAVRTPRTIKLELRALEK